MRVLVVQNLEGTGLGQIGTALAEAGAGIGLVRADRGESLPASHEGHDALVVLGGAQNALDDEAHPYLPALVGLMRSFAEADRSVLGVCLGSQLLARACGARNLIGAAPEFGWHEVRTTPAAQTDAVFGALPARFPVFQWHSDTFTLPAGAVHLAENGATSMQAFRVGRAAYGIQFHFEADRALVEDWSGRFADYLAQHQPDWNAIRPAQAARHGPRADRVGLALSRAWVATIGR